MKKYCWTEDGMKERNDPFAKGFSYYRADEVERSIDEIRALTEKAEKAANELKKRLLPVT